MKKIHYRAVHAYGVNYHLQYRFLFIFWRTETTMVGIDTWAPLKFDSDKEIGEHVISNRKYNKCIIIEHPMIKLIDPN